MCVCIKIIKYSLWVWVAQCPNLNPTQVQFKLPSFYLPKLNLNCKRSCLRLGKSGLDWVEPTQVAPLSLTPLHSHL